MAGQNEIDLRCPSTCSDIASVKATVDGIAKRQDEHFAHIKDLMHKQDDHYDSVRKRFHQVINDTNNSIGSTSARLNGDINNVGNKLRELDSKYSVLGSEVSLLTHIVAENAQQSEERHKSIMAELKNLGSKGWSVALWLILSLLGMLTAAATYIWAGRNVLP